MTTSANDQKIKIKTDIEILKQTNFKIMTGKRMGLIKNSKGIIDNKLIPDIKINIVHNNKI